MATERAWRKMLVAGLLFSGARDGNRTRTVSLGSHCRCPSITCGTLTCGQAAASP